MNTFTLLDSTKKDENGIIHYYRVSACINDFHGDRSYDIKISPMEAKILKEKDDRVQFQFNGGSKRTIMKKALATNTFGEVFGFNPYGIGTYLCCYKDEIDITINLCIEDMWKKITTRENIPSWVFDFKDKCPSFHLKD